MKYNKGFLLGKFFPFHLGHVHLIDEASKRCEHLTVIVCTQPDDIETFIPGIDRFNIMNQYYSGHKNVTVKFHQADDPQYPKEHPKFWNIWLKIVLTHIDPRESDVIFSSEEYGDYFSKLLGIKHECIDMERINVPISGTMVREDLNKCWQFLPSETKQYFRKKVAIMGPESVGKSTLTKKLANHFECEYVEEYGRTHVESGQELSEHAFQHIILRHNSDVRHKVLTTQERLIIVDTEDITTKIFYDLYYPKEQIMDLEKLPVENYDLRILIYPTNEGVQDGYRDFLDSRIEHFKLIENKVKEKDYNYVVLKGGYQDNYFEAITKIGELLL